MNPDDPRPFADNDDAPRTQSPGVGHAVVEPRPSEKPRSVEDRPGVSIVSSDDYPDASS